MLAVLAVVIGQRIYQLRNEPVAPTAPKSKPKAVDNPNPSAACTLTFNIQTVPTSTPTLTGTPGPTSTPTPTGTPGPTSTPDPSSTPTLGPTSTPNPQPGCGDACDINDNRCVADAPYCVDYSTDSIGAVCGRSQIAGDGPQCNPTPTPTTIEIPQVGVLDKTIWGLLGGAAMVILGLLFL